MGRYRSCSLAYYRLQMVDHDGSHALSEIISVARAGGNNYFAVTEVFPVPTNDALTVRYQLGSATSIALQLLDTYGRKLMTRQIVGNAGANTLPLDLSELPAGTYFLRLSAAGESVTRRVVRR